MNNNIKTLYHSAGWIIGTSKVDSAFPILICSCDTSFVSYTVIFFYSKG